MNANKTRSNAKTFTYFNQTFDALWYVCTGPGRGFIRSFDYPSHITMTSLWPRRRLKSPAASRLFTQSFIQA